MSQENAEIVRRIYTQGLLDTPSGHELLSASLIEYVNPPDAIDPGVRRGVREVSEALRNLLNTFDRSENRLKRLFDAGDSVVAGAIFQGRGAHSGAEATHEEAHTWTFEDGRPVRFEWGRDLAAALKAVGLEE